MSKDWERQTITNTWRETVSAMLRDRDVQERQTGEAEKHTHKEERKCRAPFPGDTESALSIETLSH